MNRVKSGHGFEFHHDFPFDDQVQPMFGDNLATIPDFDGPLSLKPNTHCGQFNAKGLFIGFLKKSGAERLMHPDGRSNNSPN